MNTGWSKMSKQSLCAYGKLWIERFCTANLLPVPPIEAVSVEEWVFDHVCAYYRPEFGIRICLRYCGTPAGEAMSRNWTWPCSTTDREPFGVLCHELGHHADWTVSHKKGKYWGDFGLSVQDNSGEPPLTSYAGENPAEYFAEAFRLFVSNHGLLRLVRPRTYAIIAERFKPIGTDDWTVNLGADVPERIVRSLLNKGAS